MEHPSEARIAFETKLAFTLTGVVTYPLRTWETCAQSQYRFWRQHAVSQCLKHGQMKYLYRGLVPFTIGTIFSYTMTENFEKHVLNKTSFSPILKSFLMILPTTVCFVPFELWFKRCQIYTDERPLNILRNKIQTEGFRGLYRGFSVSALQHTAATAIPLLLLPSMISVWPRVFTDGRWQLVLMGSSYLLTVIPLEVLKTRVMTAQHKELEATSSYLRIAARIVNKEGFMQLYSGWFPHSLGVGCLIAALMLLSMKWVNDNKSANDH